MRIVFDCRSVFPGMGGIGRASGCLARELPAACPEAEIFLLFGARRSKEPLIEVDNVHPVTVDAAMIDPEFEQIHLPALLDELDADLYHGTCFAVPIASGRAKRVATIHDVVFRRHPALVEPGLRAYLDRWAEVSCDVSEAVVTDSAFSRREIQALFGRPEERVDVVPLGVGAEFFGVERRNRASAPYILYVGSIEPKKNVAALVRAFHALCRRAPDLPHELWLAGGGKLPDDLATGPRVRLLGHVAEDRLPELYAGADLFCYLSEYEGFGLPPLEAMAAGVPCIVSDRSSLPEVTGAGALHVDPADPEAVAGTMERVIKDDLLRRELRERGSRTVQRYSWRASARELVAVYRRVLSSSPLPAPSGAPA